MNKERRKALAELAEKIDGLKGELESIMEDEQSYFDNMPESFQGGDKGQAAESAIDAMQSAIDNMDEAIANIQAAGE